MVLTVKRDKDGKFLKCKARWVHKGFQDNQPLNQQTDSPTLTLANFRNTCQLATNRNWDLCRVDLNAAFPQGESYDSSRDVICQLPPEANYPPYIGARLRRPAYGLNDAPRSWWNRLGTALRGYRLVPTRADRCVYMFHSRKEKKPRLRPLGTVKFDVSD